MTGTMLNVGLRLSRQYAQNAMLEMFNQLNVAPAVTAVAQDSRPSTDAYTSSIYCVVFDPADAS
ncbi:MAG: hypothetical protein N2Z21_10175 [Candidatus Sumerlaeaceae bacterium]|nr:hypothetical protein [Candidatus Sumerlaeaceae bacterium]